MLFERGGSVWRSFGSVVEMTIKKSPNFTAGGFQNNIHIQNNSMNKNKLFIFICLFFVITA